MHYNVILGRVRVKIFAVEKQ